MYGCISSHCSALISARPVEHTLNLISPKLDKGCALNPSRVGAGRLLDRGCRQQWPKITNFKRPCLGLRKRSGHCKIDQFEAFVRGPRISRAPRRHLDPHPSRVGPAPARIALQKAHMRTCQHGLTENPIQKGTNSQNTHMNCCSPHHNSASTASQKAHCFFRHPPGQPYRHKPTYERQNNHIYWCLTLPISASKASQTTRHPPGQPYRKPT